MPLELIIGPANTGVTRAVRARVVEHVRSGGRALLLVPSAPDVSRATHHLASEAALGLEVRGFDEYLDGLWAGHGDGRQVVTAVQRLVLLEESGSAASRGVFAPDVRTPGLLRTMARVVQRAAESERTPSSGHGAEGAAASLLLWLHEYECLLRQAGLVERGEAHRIIASGIDAEQLAGLIGVEGFSGLTSAQEQYLVRAARWSEVHVGLTFDTGVPATHAAAAIVERLDRVGTVTRLPPQAVCDRPAELARLEQALGTGSNDGVSGTGSVIISEAWGEESEAARIVREIQDALKIGIPPGEIAVVSRDARHLPALRPALAEAGVPAEYDARVPFQSSGLGRALLLLLAVTGPSGTYDQLLDLLRSRYGPGSEISMDALDTHARRTRNRDIPAAEAWLRRHDRECAAFLDHARSARRETGSARSERRWYGIVSAMMRRAHEGRAVAETDLALDAGATRMFIEAIRSVNALEAGRGTVAALSAALREASIALVTTDRPDHVQILSAERVRGRNYRCVIVCGLKTAEFPRRVGEDALSAASIAREFQRLGIDVAPRSDVAAERLIFYLAVTRATERLVLSWQSHDANGDPQRRSIFVEEVLDLYRSPASGARLPDEPPHRVLRLEPASLNAGGPQTHRRRLRSLVSDVDACETPTLREARRRSHRVADTASEATRRVTSEREVFSASEIEAYLQCPYRWFVASVVAPRDLDDRFDSASAGLLAHELLRRFYDVFTEQTGDERVTPETLEFARGVHATVAGSVACCEPGTLAAEAAAVRSVVRRTLGIIEADATLLPEFAPVHREWSFGMEEGDEAESLGSFALRGRIDRIDVGAGQLVVTDYKLGTVDAGRGVQRFEAEGLVQLPLYAAVAARRLGLTVGGGIYRSIRGGKPRGFISDALADGQFVRTDVVAEDEVQAVLAGALERADEAVARMRSGDIHPEPLNGSCPPYCPAASFCTEWREGRG